MTPTATLLLDCAFAGTTMAVAMGQGPAAQIVASQSTPEARSSDALAPFLHTVLKQANITPASLATVALTVGPGSFTGCRLGLAVAEALRLVHPHIAVIGLSTLQAAAVQVVAETQPQTPFAVLLDAAGGQAYIQVFSAQGAPQTPPQCLPTAQAVALAKAHNAGLVAQNSLMLNVPHAPLIGLTPATLLACAQNSALHLPPHPVYIKPLTYAKVAETIAYTAITPVVAALEAPWENPLMSYAQVAAHLAAPHHALIWHASGAHALVALVPGAVADVLTLYTPPTHRRQGHANTLLAHVQALARQAGCPALTLEVRASNAPARAAYAKAGFAAVSTRPAYYTNPPEDAVVLTCNLV